MTPLPFIRLNLVLTVLALAACDTSPEPGQTGSSTVAAPNAGIEWPNPTDPLPPGAPVILDTDMAADFDDAHTLAILHSLANAGVIELLGVVADTVSEAPFYELQCGRHRQLFGEAGLEIPCSGHNAAVATIDVINTWYGRPDLPIGYASHVNLDYAPYDSPELSYSLVLPHDPHFFHDIAEDMRDVPAAVDLYKQLLSTAEDHSVTILSVGMMTNLADLMADPDGLELVRHKVCKIVQMSGFPRDHYNVARDPDSADFVSRATPVPIWWSRTSGLPTGARLAEVWSPEDNPVAAANYWAFHEGMAKINNRPSWDQMAVWLGIFGTRDPWGNQWVSAVNRWDIEGWKRAEGWERDTGPAEVVRHPNPEGLHFEFSRVEGYDPRALVDAVEEQMVFTDFVYRREGRTLHLRAAPADRFHWSFGDGESVTATDEEVSHTYAAPGLFTVELRRDVHGGEPSTRRLMIYVP